jgi:hypothetical protein
MSGDRPRVTLIKRLPGGSSMKTLLTSVAMLAFALTEVPAQDLDRAAQMSHVTVDCSTFAKFGPNWRAYRDTVVLIKVDSKNDGVLPLAKGTAVTGILTYGIYLEDILETRCPK